MDGCGRETGQRGAAVVQARAPARGARIAQALKLRGVRKQQALASELNVHESAITRWKGGEAMSLENAVAFCAALDISADWLLLGRGTIEAHLGPRGGPMGRPVGRPGPEPGPALQGRTSRFCSVMKRRRNCRRLSGRWRATFSAALRFGARGAQAAGGI